MNHDSEYCRRRAAEARAAASRRGDSESVEIAGDLALAYATLARRRAQPVETPAASTADQPLMLQS